ncbi:hypothetical protein LAWASA_4015 [Lawsonibacter asaccharolyticus]|nr:hypothetical protein LAWASA_4015 [Lawsonibacter asaccharolyticus]
MADNGLNNMGDVSQQASDQVTGKIKEKAEKGAKEVANKVGKKVGKAVKKGAKKVAKATAKVVKAAVKAAVKTAVTVIKTLISLIVKLLVVAWPFVLILLVIVIVLVVIADVIYGERGSGQVNDFNPAVMNPTLIDENTKAVTALAQTEPQAVVDAYYKYLSTQSFTKEYNDKLYEFADEDETADFSALRDYYDGENYFYLSDDFIRMVDETLHGNVLYYPEQVIKPVFGKNLTVENKEGNEMIAYTSLLPTGYASGDKSPMYEDNFDKPEDSLVKDFDKIVTDRSQLDVADIDGINDETPSLIAKSQTPTEHGPGDGTAPYYSLTERNVIDGSGGSGSTEPGLWDYGFGSVLQYEPHQKIQYITCTYTDVDADIDRASRHWIETEDGGEWSDWSDWSHYEVKSFPVPADKSQNTLEESVQDHIDTLPTGNKDGTVEYKYTYALPTNIKAILSDTTNWDNAKEPNKDNEATINREFANEHIDMKVEGAKDIEISRLEFSSDLDVFANHGTALYPLNIAVINHAATFSGNIHYTITPAGEDGCVETRTPLQSNTTAVSDHREAVKTIKVSGACSDNVQLTATREGEMIVQTPKVEETDSPWGFAYLQQYADNYVTYAPNNYMNDRDFFLRSGLKAVQSQLDGTANEAENKEAQQYADNLEFLLQLGFLKPYSGSNLTAMGMVDMGDMQDSNSDLYILAKCIAAEAHNGSTLGKLDELLVGAVFVNRVKGDNTFPDTYWEVLTAPGQYACYSNGSWAKANPTESEIASAIQCMTGQFALPSNVLFQSQNPNQGTKIFMTNGVHYYNLAYTNTPSPKDIWDRPALDPDEIRALAAKLDGADPSTISGQGISFDLSKTVFIGDSLTVGLNNTNKLSSSGAMVLAQKSASTDQIRELVEDSNASRWAGKEVAYICAGTNNHLDYEDNFIKKYNKLIDAIYEKAGNNIKIYVLTMPPVQEKYDSSVSNEWIKKNNQSIQKVADSKGIQIIDIWSVLQQDGKLNPEYDSGDGLHLNEVGYKVWYNYIRGGITTSTIGTGEVNINGIKPGNGDIESDWRLYEIEDFDLLDAVNMQAHLGTEDETARNWLESTGAWFISLGESAANLIANFFKAMDELLFAPPDTTLDHCFRVATQYNSMDVEALVYSSITFSTQLPFGSVEDAYREETKDEHRVFLFVGKNAIKGLGTMGYGNTIQLVPGTGTTIDGIISPTGSYYPPLNAYNGTYIEYQVGEGTSVLAVGDGKIIEVDDVGATGSSSKGKYVVQEVNLPDGKVMQVTYGNLKEVSVSTGSTVSSGDLIGKTGKNHDGTASLYLSVTIDGANVDPSTIFYQPSWVYGAGSLGQNLNNADGTINKEALKQLREELNLVVGLQPNSQKHNPYSPSDFNPAGKMPYLCQPMNTLTPLQCTWWARGRGLQYVMTFYPGRVTVAQFKQSNRGNGGEIYYNARVAGIFGTGTTPKPNSLVSMDSSSSYGHVAYVEAVDYVNKRFYISEAGSGTWWGSLGQNGISFNDSRIRGFVYLDEILI